MRVLLHAMLLGVMLIGSVCVAESLHFEKVRIGDVTYEAASVCDLDRDGVLDIVSGGVCFRGPDFSDSVRIFDVTPVDEYFNDFSDYPLDVNGDGWLDIVTGGYWSSHLVWYENPGELSSGWKSHPIGPTGNIETTRFGDIDGDGTVEAVPNAGGNVVVFRLKKDQAGQGTGEFETHMIKQGGCGHGLGYGDINGDGRGDLIIPDGWLEQGEDPWSDPWGYHPEFNLGAASVPILVHDVNRDGSADLIVGQAHGYGLDWFEQRPDHTWVKHSIDPDNSQYHDMQLVDIDNDGELELITGKRYRAHNGHDPGSGDPLGTYYFKIAPDGTFTKHVIDYGPPEQASGVGIYFWVADLDDNGWLDIVAPGKEGLYRFLNQGF